MTAVSTIQASARARVGTVLKDKWQLDALLGVGGTAAVYSATHRNGKRAAVKILHQELAGNEGLVVRFLREGYVANKLEHAGAVSVLDDDRTEDGSVYLVMELLEGRPLDVHTRGNQDRLSVSECVRIGDEVLDVLANAHTRGVIHRDIKPANLFLTTAGQVKVLDFGIARLREGNNDASATQTGSTLGTPAYMPPEQARGRWQVVDARTDIWAVGATLFALLAGKRPRRADTVNEELLLAMTEPMPKLLAFAPHVPVAIAMVIDRALEFEMEGRFPDARSMQMALRQALADVGPEVDSPTLVASPAMTPGAHYELAHDQAARDPSHASQPSASPASRSWPNHAQPGPPPQATPFNASVEQPPTELLDPRFTTNRPIHADAPHSHVPVVTKSNGAALAIVIALGVLVLLIGGGAAAFLKVRAARAASAPVPTMEIPTTPTTPTTTSTTSTSTTTPTPTTTPTTTSTSTSTSTLTSTSTSTLTSTLTPTLTPTPSSVGRPSRPSGTPRVAPNSSAGNPWDQRF